MKELSVKYSCLVYSATLISSLTHQVASVALIETSQLVCCANQLTDFYMRATLALNGLKTK